MPHFLDAFSVADFGKASVVAGRKALTLAQGLTNGRHTLEISGAIGSGTSLIAAIVVYRPPVSADAPRVTLAAPTISRTK